MSRGEPVIETIFAGTGDEVPMIPTGRRQYRATIGNQHRRSDRLTYQGVLIMTRALIVADPQRDFCEGGSLGVAGGAAAVSRIDSCSAVIMATPMWSPLVIITSSPALTSPTSRISSTRGRRTVWSARRALSFMINSPSATSQPSSTRASTSRPTQPSRASRPMARRCQPGCGSRGVDQLDICGIATDYCVRATALDAVREGFETTVLLDLTAAVAPHRVEEISAELVKAGVTVTQAGWDLHILSTLGGATVANASWQIALSSASSIPGS